MLLTRARSAVVVALSVVAACGCGSSAQVVQVQGTQPTTTSGASPSARAFGWYPADTALDERGAVEAYVQALDERDGGRFCRVVAPWISGRFDITGTDPDAPFLHPERCPELVSGLIGYIEDCCPPKFLGARIVHSGDLERRKDVVGVPVTVSIERQQSGVGTSAPKYEERVDDVVWVTRDAGAWRVAKLSRVAAAASIGLQSQEDLTSPPDVAAERRSFAALVATTKRERRERDASYRAVTSNASCPGATSYPDGRKDVVDYMFPHPSTPTPQVPAADIRSVQVAASKGRICVLFSMAGHIRRGTTFEFAVESPELESQRAGFSQFFDVELAADGRARVSSGRSIDRSSLSVPADVALEGDRLGLVLTTASFAAGRPAPLSPDPASARPLLRFFFLANATLALSQQRHLHDDLGPAPPRGVVRYRYPR